MTDELVERLKTKIAETFAPAIDARAPYAVFMIDKAARACLAEIAAAGRSIVPNEPTEEMWIAGDRLSRMTAEECRMLWSAMLAASRKV